MKRKAFSFAPTEHLFFVTLSKRVDTYINSRNISGYRSGIITFRWALLTMVVVMAGHAQLLKHMGKQAINQ